MKQSTLEFNPLSGGFVDSLFADYQQNPDAVPPDWRAYFERLRPGRSAVPGPDGPAVHRHAPPRTAPMAAVTPEPAGKAASSAVLQDRVDQLLRAYRVRGHMVAQIDPLGLPRAPQPELELAAYGLAEADLERRVSCRTLVGPKFRPLREVLDCIRNTYCRSIGVQFMHIDDLHVRHWLQERMEGTQNHLALSRRQQFRILTRLTDALVFEEFVAAKYVGAKTFSLEGCETLIPLLDLAIERAGEQGIREIVIGMTHRGRLNVLANILGKPCADIFREFEEEGPRPLIEAGDVRYHQGYSGEWETAAGAQVHLSLCFNPSHLEYVGPVALGRLRAKQDRAGHVGRDDGMALLIHGDAAFAGGGIVQETLNLSELPGYTVGGTVHIIINNQIGFTTSPEEGRSSTYATGVARMLQVPIFHVNGEDPEAVAQVVHLALDFRQEFRRDVVIDMYGFRRRGHNEMDEPSFTQPVMYRAVRQRESVRHGYLERLARPGHVTQAQAEELLRASRQRLDEQLALSRSDSHVPEPVPLGHLWTAYGGGGEPHDEGPDTGVEATRLADLLNRLLVVPEGFHRHPRLERFVEARRQMAAGTRPLDWSAAEALTLASLAAQGIRVRLSGQDSARGTFSQRHAFLYDYEDGSPYSPFQHLSPDQAPVEVFNSPLSEAGVLGFEYGYSLDCPDSLILWEAQYGDFANAAQVILDQFIASAEDKWKRLSGLVLLLPHGFEGQGPEHSSARIERFLTLAAEDNMQIAQPSTPAQYFHLLRRQALRPWRKPLVVFTPKSLLRHPAAVSRLDDLAQGRFQRVLADAQSAGPRGIRLVLLCAGKIYYELDEARRSLQRTDDVAILRLEQFYPLRAEVLEAALACCGDGTAVRWVQEEPENMGAWRDLRARFGDRLLGRFPFSGVYRPASASPAAGSLAAHKREQARLIEQAFAD